MGEIRALLQREDQGQAPARPPGAGRDPHESFVESFGRSCFTRAPDAQCNRG